MSGFYAGLQQTALSLLRTYGQPMTLTSRAPGAYNPATATAAIASSTTATVGAIFDIRGQEFDPQMVQTGDRKIIMASAGMPFAPEPGMRVTVAGADWAVVTVKRVDPAAFNVIYKLQVRQ